MVRGLPLKSKNGIAFDCLVQNMFAKFLLLPIEAQFCKQVQLLYNSCTTFFLEAIRQVSEDCEIEQCLVLGRHPHTKIRFQSRERERESSRMLVLCRVQSMLQSVCFW